ncbi:MAG: hypothetical protein KGJ30_16335, partial [Burkholderiales bacterium]|nr:hypothetical protein [Burkholderiales bacterium]
MTALRRRLRALSGSIKTRVTLAAVAALALGIGLTTLILVTAAERATLATERDRELQEGVRTAAILTHRVVDLQRALQATASTLDEPTLRDRVRLAAFMDSKPVLRGLFSSLFVAAPDGRLLTLVGADGARASRLSVSDRPYFTRTVAEQRPIVSEPVASRADGKPVVVLTYPLRNAHGVYGVLAGVLDLRRRNLLQDLVDDPDDADDGTSTLVVVTDARGRVLAHPNRERLMQPIADEPRMADGYARWLAEGGASGGAVEPSGLRLPQAGQVLIVAGVPGPDWLVWRATPQAALLAPLRAARHKALRWASVIVAGASLFLLATLGWLLRPLSLLEARAMHLFDDDAPVHAGWPEVGGEIGALARVLRHVGAERAQLEQFNAQVLVKLRSVMTAAPIGILFTRDDQFELVSAHLGTLLGRDEQALLGRPVASIFALPDDHARLGPLVAEAWADARPYLGEWRFLRADGSAFWGQLRGLPVEPGHPD